MLRNNQTRRDFMKYAATGAAALALAGPARVAGAGLNLALPKRDGARTGAGKKRPNVVVVLTDDQGFGDIASHQNPKIDTPVMDRLAAEGARFDRFYVSPVCSPTRASFLTGRYDQRMGVSGTSAGLETMRLGETTIAEVFKGAGYATGCFGKWHNGGHWPYHPNARGFDEFYGFTLGHWNNYFDTELQHNGGPVKTKGYINDVLTDAALKWIDENHSRPFFCYIPYNTPHTPFQVPDEYYDAGKARGLNDILASAYGMCKNLDDNIGRVLALLEKRGTAGDTIVVFFGDNGPNTGRFNGNMRGRKGSVHEGGVRNSLFIRWPAGIKPGTVVRPIAAHIDLLPTLAALAGAALPKTRPLDGRSFAPLLRGEEVDWPARMIFSRWGGRGAVRTQTHRLVIENGPVQLYDMVRDPGEHHDIAEKKPRLAARLKQAYDEWLADVAKDGYKVPPIPVGYDEMPKVVMTCSEGEWEGELDWGGRFPNNNWATKWTSLDCQVSWNIDVVKAGEYAVILEYICPRSDLGSRVAVEAAGSRVENVIDIAAEPNYVYSPDRVKRAEVYERIWGHKKLGTLRLPKGLARLTIKALSKAGAAVMDLKSVQIERVEQRIARSEAAPIKTTWR